MDSERFIMKYPTAMLTNCLVVWLAGAPAFAQTPALRDRQNSIPGVLADGAVVELVKDGFGNVDGPVAGPDGALYFSDVGVGETYRILSNGAIELVDDFNNAATSLSFDQEGRLIALEGLTGRVVAVEGKDRSSVLAEASKGDRYAPNDLVVDREGGVFFTDPASASQGGDTRTSRVLYVRRGRPPLVITSAITRPTGITLTLDRKMLVIADSFSGTLMAMDVQPDGAATNLRPWTKLNSPDGRTGAPEGLAIDAEGRIYAATTFGVQVYSRAGDYLGLLRVPRIPSNLAFGGADRKTLYITARSAVYRIRTLAAGPSDRSK